ncbi:uncharacterized protein BDZ99DRAFT_471988 [Mytilinidion resinicola]|uniref:Uncharacterized protein n=1 Tax=Mytilinidion resinicola TaxID=574789 RepID=A0A6A6Z2W4_9PEZI|nr:uncharacterized protein BDZ99DRAFT_471988 [Mytilinidion resinicola]KAF2814577.1 hypothetical protein BDZ99DRAFT_471988 [Mytilinidion resinicola]
MPHPPRTLLHIHHPQLPEKHHTQQHHLRRVHPTHPQLPAAYPVKRALDRAVPRRCIVIPEREDRSHEQHHVVAQHQEHAEVAEPGMLREIRAEREEGGEVGHGAEEGEVEDDPEVARGDVAVLLVGEAEGDVLDEGVEAGFEALDGGWVVETESAGEEGEDVEEGEERYGHGEEDGEDGCYAEGPDDLGDVLVRIKSELGLWRT